MGEREEHPIGDARPETDPVSGLELAAKSHPGPRRLGIDGPHRAKLGLEQGLHPLRSGCKKFQDLCHERAVIRYYDWVPQMLWIAAFGVVGVLSRYGIDLAFT